MPELQHNVTVESVTYPKGTATKDVDNAEHRKVLEANKALFHEGEESDTSVGAGSYDGREWTIAKLEAEVERRNEGVPEEQQIHVEGTRKSDFVAALETHDENHPVTT